jgi:hypothetical protein
MIEEGREFVRKLTEAEKGELRELGSDLAQSRLSDDER